MPPVITCAAALNPYYNVSGVELLIETISMNLEVFDDGHATKAKQWFNESLEGNPMTTLLNKLKEKSNKRAKNDRSGSSEYERYVNEDFIQHLKPNDFAGFDVLSFWKAKETMFPVLSRMAMDLIRMILDAEVQENEAIALSDDEIALDAASQSTRSNGSGSRGEEFDYDLTLSE
ncbi:zinc finger BED domain-containing protein RICESLEEPER 2-like protein [Tanacetum coccineum]